MNPNKCSLGFFNDKPELDQKENGKIVIMEINRELQATVTLTPVQFKHIAHWMVNHVKAYEKRFGKIELVKPPKDKGTQQDSYRNRMKTSS